jgi:hypothetical protein
MKKHASIFQKPTEFIIQADAPSGRAWLASTPILTVPSTISAEALGEALLKVLEQEQSEKEWPTDWKEGDKEHLRQLGMKSYKELFKNCNFCSVEFNGDTFSLNPSKNEKTGFTFFANSTLIIRNNNSTVIGEAILQTLAMCK